jgi:hypothetical protein
MHRNQTRNLHLISLVSLSALMDTIPYTILQEKDRKHFTKESETDFPATAWIIITNVKNLVYKLKYYVVLKCVI